MSIKNGYIKQDNGSKYLTLVYTYANKDTLKNNEEIWKKIKHIIRSLNNNSHYYDGKIYIKIKISLDDNLSLKKSSKTA